MTHRFVDHLQTFKRAVFIRSAQIVFQVVVNIGIFPILLVRRCCHDTAADVLNQLHESVVFAGKMEFCHIADQRIGYGDVAVHDRILGRGVGQCAERFHIRGNICNFIPDMSNLEKSVVFGHGHGAAGHHLDGGHLIADGRKTMEGSKGIGKEHGELPFAAHEDPFPGDKDVVKNDDGLGQLSHRTIGVKLMICPGSATAAAYKGNAFGVGWNSEAHGIVGFVFAHLPGRDDDDLIGCRSAGDVNFCALHDDAVFVLVHDMKIVVGVLLLGWFFSAVPL